MRDFLSFNVTLIHRDHHGLLFLEKYDGQLWMPKTIEEQNLQETEVAGETVLYASEICKHN